ncbi:MAG: hypothetical protein M0C28_44570 [Candidatus Moduliflexus flocculans]|nr:hypothetical protein [Candidatus Moduliflexus flocculans]
MISLFEPLNSPTFEPDFSSRILFVSSVASMVPASSQVSILMDADLRPVFDHDGHGVSREEFVLESQIALELFLDGGDQFPCLSEVITARDDKIVLDRLWLLDEALYIAILTHLRHTEAARVGDGHDPGDRISRLMREETRNPFRSGVSEKTIMHRPVQVFARQPQGMGLSLHFVLHNKMRLHIGVFLFDEGWNLEFPREKDRQ